MSVIEIKIQEKDLYTKEEAMIIMISDYQKIMKVKGENKYYKYTNQFGIFYYSKDKEMNNSKGIDIGTIDNRKQWELVK